MVVDFDNCIFDAKEKRISVDNNNVFSIRAAQNSLSPDITRVVIDLHEWSEYNIGPSHDRKAMYIDIGSEERKITEDKIIEGEYTLNPQAKDKIVVIDPGHGGKDPGAVFKGEDNTVLLKEADLNLDICLRLYKLLQGKGVKVYMTRSDDSFVELKDIAEFANNLNAHLFISVHNNAMTNNEDYDGTMTLYHPLSDDKTYGITSKDLAEIVQEELIKKLGTTDRGIRERPNLAVLKNTKMPAIIAEVAFITNTSDRAKLMTDDFLQKAAEAICVGIIRALNKSISE